MTGSFNRFIIYFSLILIHELGHFLAAYICGWNIDVICFYPYGGYSKFNEDINRPLKEELLILISGPIVQIIYYLIIINFININDIELLKIYHFSILFFNLLPIYPLDGGRLLNILLSYFFSYKNSYLLTIYISFIVIILIILGSYFYSYNLSFNLYLMISLIFVKLIDAYKKRGYYYNKFKLERWLKDYRFNKLKIINNVDKMMRDKRHLIRFRNNYVTERELLNGYFIKNKYN